jgi:hypothetical protein
LPLAHHRIVVKVDIAGQATLGTVNHTQEGAAVCRLWVELDGLLHPKAKRSLHFQLDGSDRAFLAQFGKHLVKVHAVFIPRLAFCGDVLAGHRCSNALLVEPSLERFTLWDGGIFSNEGQEPAKDADLVLDGGSRLSTLAPVLDQLHRMGFANLADVLHACANFTQLIEHADEFVGVEGAGAFGHGACATSTGTQAEFAKEHGHLRLGVLLVALLGTFQSRDARAGACPF